MNVKYKYKGEIKTVENVINIQSVFDNINSMELVIDYNNFSDQIRIKHDQLVKVVPGK